MAVDLIVQKCVHAGLIPLRFGLLERIKEDLRSHSLLQKVEEHPFRRYRLDPKERKEAELENAIAKLKGRLKQPEYGTNIFDAGIRGGSDALGAAQGATEKEKREKARERQDMQDELGRPFSPLETRDCATGEPESAQLMPSFHDSQYRPTRVRLDQDQERHCANISRNALGPHRV